MLFLAPPLHHCSSHQALPLKRVSVEKHRFLGMDNIVRLLERGPETVLVSDYVKLCRNGECGASFSC